MLSVTRSRRNREGVGKASGRQMQEVTAAAGQPATADFAFKAKQSTGTRKFLLGPWQL